MTSEFTGTSAERAAHRRLCVVCTRTDLDAASPRREQCCRDCEDRTRRTLTDLLDVLAVLPVAYHRSASPPSDKVRGSSEPSMPGGDALVILGPGREVLTVGYDEDGTRNLGHLEPDIWRDDDPEPAVSALCGWEDDWRAIQGHAPRPVRPWESGQGDQLRSAGQRQHIAEAIMGAARYLAACNRWAAEHHPEYDEYAQHLTQLRDRAERILHADTLVHRLPHGCPHCPGRLVREDGDDKVRCPRCDRSWPEDDYRRLTLILGADSKPAPKRARRAVVHSLVREGAGFVLCSCGWQGHRDDRSHVWTTGEPPAAKHLPSETGETG